MHILLCHERFLPRFGVDRLLLRCAREFRRQGHRVTLIGQNFDPAEVSGVADNTIVVPPAEPYICSDLHTARWLAEEWTRMLATPPPDIAISGGWPFFSSLRIFADRGCRTVFCDCGITPSEGLAASAQKTLNLLDGLKRIYVPLVDAIAPISDFLLESQVRAIASPDQLVRTIRLSGSHILDGDIGVPTTDSSPIPDVLVLGRYETGNYKQAEWVIPFAQALAQCHLRLTIGVLATAQELGELPSELREVIVPLGHPADRGLKQLMGRAKCTVVFSRWEGFNLPLAEAATLGAHCLVLDCGAHPEVVADRWYLCLDLKEMIAKALALLANTAPPAILDRRSLDGYANRRTWKDVTGDYVALIEEVRGRPDFRPRPNLKIRRDSIWLIDVTNAAHDPANSGVTRVSRRLSAEIQKILPCLLVIWDPVLGTLRFPYDAEFAQLKEFGGPERATAHPTSFPGEPFLLSHYLGGQDPIRGWLLIPEIRHEPGFAMIRRQAAAWGLRTAAIFYDAIPLLRPDLVADPVYRNNHKTYMRGLAECDLILPISVVSERDLKDFWQEPAGRNHVRTCLLPGSAGEPRLLGSSAQQKQILCVSTLEPRKGHRRLIEAFLSVGQNFSESWELVLVGNRYAGAEDLAVWIEGMTQTHSNIRWLGIVSDEELSRLYRQSAFTVYASEIEGFGLPILESVWHGVPCLCDRSGVMAELAQGGGCVTADLGDPTAFRQALEQLMIDATGRQRLSDECRQRSVKTWGDYTIELLGHLLLRDRVDGYEPPPVSAPAISWEEYLYPDCLRSNWQMNDVERIALAALLQRQKPRVSLEIGTFRGGSLSLIRQYSQVVFSIDIDESVRREFAWMSNVSFLIGSSREILPPLLNALEAAGLSPEFVLIDGDHSQELVQADIECLLDFVPRRACMIVMYGSINSGCRSGMMAARWARSPYVHFVDVDFVPGRIVEDGGRGSGECLGGLGVALLFPTPRQNPLKIGGSAQRMVEALQEAQPTP